MKAFIRLIKCIMMFYAAMVVFILATFWVVPADESGTGWLLDTYAAVALLFGVVSAVRHWGVLKRRELQGKQPFDWKLFFAGVGVYFGSTCLFALVAGTICPGMMDGTAAVPSWCEGLVVGGPTIATIAYVFAKKRKKKKLLEELREPEEQPAGEPKPEPRQTVTADPRAMYLHRLRKCDEAIPDTAVSAKIRKMEQTLGRIFEWVESHPQAEGELKRLMDFYLPTTVKLLETYADLDSLELEGENIRASKREIEGSLDDLNRAYEKLMDDLVADTALDISTDISVLKSMLAREGLTEDELTRMLRETE